MKIIIHIEMASSVSELSVIQKLRGSRNCYKIRVGDYGMGVVLRNDELTFVRLLHRKEIYRYFPK